MVFDLTAYQGNAFAQNLIEEAKKAARKNTVPPELIEEKYKDIERLIQTSRNLAIVGPAQTGKSTAVLIAAARLGIPMAVFLCNDSFSAANFIGRWAPNPNEGVNGDTRRVIWIPGVGTLCYTMGIPICLEEGYNIPEERQEPLFKIMDGSDSFTADNGEIVYRHPNFRLVMTGNPGYKGNRKLNEAFASRFNATISLPDVMPENAFKAIAKSYQAALTDKFIDATYQLTKAAIAKAASLMKDKYSCGVRQLEGLVGVLGMRNIPYADFFRHVEETMIDGLALAQIPYSEIQTFKAQPATQAFVKVMYKEYVDILAQNGQTVGQPAAATPQAQGTSGSPKCGEDLLAAMMSQGANP